MTTASATSAAIAAAIHTEQVAAFGYGTLGPHLSENSRITLARECEQAHQQLAANSMNLTTPSPPGSTDRPGSYELPTAPVDEATAQQLALQLEQACASAWRYALAQLTESANRAPAGTDPTWAAVVAALTDSAVRAVQWRTITDPAAPSVPFPGIG